MRLFEVNKRERCDCNHDFRHQDEEYERAKDRTDRPQGFVLVTEKSWELLHDVHCACHSTVHADQGIYLLG